MADLLLGLIKVNLAVALAVGVVLLLRRPLRRRLGARLAYGLWALPPLAALAMLAPRRVITVDLPAALADPAAPAIRITDAMRGLGAGAPTLPVAFDPAPLLAAAWIAGAVFSLMLLFRRQARFEAAARGGLAGPAVAGLLRPRIVIPTDFADRYTERERQVVLAHEQAHLARQDCRINALMALACCLAWFNPLLHVMARCLRIDQELACDARVAAGHPTALRSYAEAMLKAQLAAAPLPMGCYWPAPSAHPLAERIALLSAPPPGAVRRRLGGAAVALGVMALGWSAWAVQPAKVLWVAKAAPAPAIAVPTPASAPTAAPLAARPAPSPPGRAAPEVKAPGPAEPSLAASPAGLAADPPVGLVEAAERAFSVFAPMPSRRIYAAAPRSQVQPGYAVRVLAEMTDPQGAQLTTDLTAYGSQQRYRTGYFRRRGSHQALFTAVVQQGDRLLVTASLDRRFAPETSGSVVLRSGEQGAIRLANGQMVMVTPTLRAETAEEMEAGRRARRAEEAWAL